MKPDFHIVSSAVLLPGEAPDVSFVPPLARRRLSPLQKIFFALANRVGTTEADAVVFASRDGEDTLTRRIVDEFRADGSVSPHRFSSSVYNAAPGLWSVLTRNRTTYTAIAAGDDTVECGILEALSALKSVPSATLVYAEETGCGHGAAMRLATDGGGGRITLADAHGGGGVAFGAFADFITGRSDMLDGRFIALSRRR